MRMSFRKVYILNMALESVSNEDMMVNLFMTDIAWVSNVAKWQLVTRFGWTIKQLDEYKGKETQWKIILKN